MSVGFHGRIVGNSTFANSDNPLGWYSTLFQFCGNKPALDILKESLILDVPVELSAAPVTLTDKLYFLATRASSSRLSLCEVSVRCVVLRAKRNRWVYRCTLHQRMKEPWNP